MSSDGLSLVPNHFPSRRPRKTELRCPLCNEPVALETAKTDENGKAIHEECYALKTLLKQEAKPVAAVRAWREIVKDIVCEKDPQRTTSLILELSRALDEQLPPRPALKVILCSPRTP